MSENPVIAKTQDGQVVYLERKGIVREAVTACPLVIPAVILSLTAPPAAVACAGMVKNIPVDDSIKLMKAGPSSGIISIGQKLLA